MSKNKNISTIRLSFGHNLLTGNAPKGLTVEQVTKAYEDATDNKELINRFGNVESFGFFDTSTPNFNTYHPEVTPEELQPQEGDYIKPIYRALSEVTVHKKRNPINFGLDGILKKSMQLLLGQTIYPNHEASIGNDLGVVSGVAWEQSYKTAGGIIIPAGINAELKIDGKSHPKIARGINSSPPSIHSTSATVEFMWKKSHEQMSDDEFWSKLGGYDNKGVLIERQATRIINYHELSLVAHGADPFAQKVGDNGQIVNPRHAQNAYAKLSQEEKTEQKHFFFSFKDVIQNNEEDITIPLSDIKENNIDITMKETFVKLAALLSLTWVDGDEEDQTKIDAILNGAKNTLDTATSLTTQLEAEKTKVTNLTNEITSLKETGGDSVRLKAFENSILDNLRTETIKNAGLALGTALNDTIQNSIKASNYDALILLNAQYQTQAEEKTPLTCQNCHSTDVSRKTSKNNQQEKPDSTKMAIPKHLTNKSFFAKQEEIGKK